MEAKPAEDMFFSVRTVIKYGSIAVLILSLAFLPALFSPLYLNVLNTLLLIAILTLIIRSFIGIPLSFQKTKPPDYNGEWPGVSIIIPAYNEGKVLPDTIESLQELDYPRDKLQVIISYETSSSDKTAEICEQAARENDFITAVASDEPNGSAAAFNDALEHADHDILTGIDADHQFKPDAIKRAVKWFEKDDDIWCVKGRCYGRNPDESLLALNATVERHIAEKLDIYTRDLIDGYTFYGGSAFFFRKEVIDEIGELDEEILVEDIDMSTKIHKHGKDIQIDPYVITYEENPATLRSWWAQRKRWARGWMQVTERYLFGLFNDSNMTWRKKADAAYTLTYAIVPTFLVLLIPLFVLAMMGHGASTLLPFGSGLWTLVGVSPAILAAAIFLQDFRDGETHHWQEYLAPITLWFYLMLQSTVYLTAFIEEFILQKPSVFVTTARTG
ncbi:MAG: glycosyltransferase family 2 protein [Candidatus Nanohaloarchaea archaeon]|nr:glycosyltransferase family 2 protein [Candidatus Nanohaloarchaea archaeon]